MTLNVDFGITFLKKQSIIKDAGATRKKKTSTIDCSMRLLDQSSELRNSVHVEVEVAHAHIKQQQQHCFHLH